MRVIVIRVLLTLLGLNSLSCYSKDDESRYAWQPHIAAPIYYPVVVKYGFVFSGKGDSYSCFPIMDRVPIKGIAQQGEGVVLSEDQRMPIPWGLNIMWMCLIEGKIYDFINYRLISEEMDSKLASLFEQGYYDNESKCYRTYEDFIITLLPGGKILLHLGGIGRTVHFATLQAQELNMSMAHFEYKGRSLETPKEFAQRTLPIYYPRALANFKKNGLSYRLWDRYLQRFSYKIGIEFENEETVIDPDYSYDFTNGDMFNSLDGVEVESLARIKKIAFSWSVADTTYTGHIYFNEEDVLYIFDEAYRYYDRTQKGELSIRVGKDNNRFDILLRVGDKEYRFDDEKRTMIHVSKRGVDQRDEDAVVFYSNHQHIHSSEIKFIGE